ncbi:MAG TPA: ATP-dependent zinc protease [Alphaproteobacteria bacterium]|nr:ATP-dependent zinc protease [Alphaproteobacteria bacterium]
MVKPSSPKKKKPVIGWEEWCAFPDLGLPAVKAKIDTGAKTSALHAYDLEPFKKDGQDYLRFKVHPIQRNREIECVCEAPLVDYRYVTSSNGEREKRYVIETTFQIGENKFVCNLTLTTRYGMKFRMLLGKKALMQGKFLVDVSKSYIHGCVKNAKELYL